MNLLTAHPVAVGAAALYVFSAAVDALPNPEAVRTLSLKALAYQWLFGFTHTLLNNAEAAVRAKYPNFALGSGSQNPTKGKDGVTV